LGGEKEMETELEIPCRMLQELEQIYPSSPSRLVSSVKTFDVVSVLYLVYGSRFKSSAKTHDP
jgi:hypothetical protein